MLSETQRLIEKIKALPAERITEVETFVDFLHYKAHEPQMKIG
ncbi:MAG: hypothetical protein RL748_1547, partial [Pseudomonadota bacterium]